jgi:hypothetical protein
MGSVWLAILSFTSHNILYDPTNLLFISITVARAVSKQAFTKARVIHQESSLFMEGHLR